MHYILKLAYRIFHYLFNDLQTLFRCTNTVSKQFKVHFKIFDLKNSHKRILSIKTSL